MPNLKLSAAALVAAAHLKDGFSSWIKANGPVDSSDQTS